MIKIGPAGSGSSSIDGLRKIASFGMDAVEIEFTYGVRMQKHLAKKLGEEAKKLKISLSVHAPYYINLASDEPEKRLASIKRILMSCERADDLGAKYVVFHPAFYGKHEKDEVYIIVKDAIELIQEEIKRNGWKVVLAPETTGKGSQFGNLDELLRLKKETGCHLTVDFAHIKARNKGNINYDDIFSKLNGTGHIHAHFSGIEFTEKGERRHLITETKELKNLIDAAKKHNADITIINESPDPIEDSIRTKKLL